MNKKRLTITILILMIAVMEFASTIDPTDPTPSVPKTAEQTLDIYAYKMGDFGEDGIKFEITDALTNSLQAITTGKDLEITPFKSEFLSAEVPSTDFNRKLIFSYRLSGNTTGTYTIKITATPFYKVEDPENIPQTPPTNFTDNEVIDNYMIFENHTLQFFDGQSFVNTYEGWSILYSPSGIENESQSDFLIDGIQGHQQHSITEEIIVTKNTSDNPPQYWIAKAGIAMSISAEDYYGTLDQNPAEKGLYICNITVTLTT